MKLTRITACAISLILTYSYECQAKDTNQATDQFYVSGGLGVENFSLHTGTKTDIGEFASVSLGYIFAKHHLRLEGELSGGQSTLTESDGTKDTFTAAGLSAQIYYDIPVKSSFVPYVGGGLGVFGTGTKYKSGGNYNNGNEIITPDIEAGFNYILSKKVAIGLSDRLQYLPMYNGSDSGYANIVKANVRYAF